MRERDVYLPSNYKEKMFPIEYSKLPQMRIPCLLSNIAKISILIGSHKPPHRNSPVDIPPTSMSDILAVHV